MDAKAVVVYIFVNMFCMATSFILLEKFTRNIGSATEISYFRKMVFCFLGFLLCEIIWVLGYGNIIALPPIVYGLIKVVGTFCIPLMVYFWSWFAMTKFNSPLIKSGKAPLLTAIPIILLFIIYVLSFKFGIVFKINPDMTISDGPGKNLSGLVDNIYGVAIILQALHYISKSKNRLERPTYVLQIVFILICTFGGFIDGIAQQTPVMALAICLSFIFMFINLQEPHIYNDALTGLFNRRRADVHLHEQLEKVSPNNPCYVFLLDINDFKKINDLLGHLEGDRAIKVVASSVQMTANRHRGFCARWGGDEFIVIANSNVAKFDVLMMNELKQNVRTASINENLGYVVDIAVGYSKITSRDADVYAAIKQADQMLYSDKK